MATFPNTTALSKLHQSLSRRSLMREMGIAGALAVVPASALAAPQHQDSELLDLHQQWLAAKADHNAKCAEEIRTFDLAQEARPEPLPMIQVVNRKTGHVGLMTDEYIENFGVLWPDKWKTLKRQALADYRLVMEGI
jgi:hypothetical protein